MTDTLASQGASARESVPAGAQTDAGVGMALVLRLLRISLILRIAIVAGASIVGGMVTGANTLVTLPLMLPSILLLVIVTLALNRGRIDARFVNGILAAAIIAQTLEEVSMRLLLRTGVLSPPGVEFPRGPRSPLELLLGRSLFGSALITAIPAILGAWISGRRGAIKWALFATAVSAWAELLIVLPDVEVLRFILGSIASQGLVIMVLAYFVGSLADQVRNEQRQLLEANEQLREQTHMREQLIASRERVRLARDLHDTLAHTLAGLIVQMNAIDTLIDVNVPAAKSELGKARVSARQGLDETRAAIGDLRANMVEALGLSGALRRQCEVLGQRTGASVKFELRGDEPQLNNSQAEVLFRIAQEAMNNVERHAHAGAVMVMLDTTPGPGASVVLSIRDDGIGFNTESLDDDRFGLRGMRERAELIGAHLRVESASSQGTTVTLTLPSQWKA